MMIIFIPDMIQSSLTATTTTKKNTKWNDHYGGHHHWMDANNIYNGLMCFGHKQTTCIISKFRSLYVYLYIISMLTIKANIIKTSVYEMKWNEEKKTLNSKLNLISIFFSFFSFLLKCV